MIWSYSLYVCGALMLGFGVHRWRAKRLREKEQLEQCGENLVHFVEDVVCSFEPVAERRGLTLEFHADAEFLGAAFASANLRKVMGNLLSNVLAFIPAGGQVLVSVSREETPLPEQKGPVAAICVRYVGPNLPLEEQSRCCQADGAAEPKSGEAGDGLALEREPVELQGGAISVESKPGFGAAFTVRLPMISGRGREKAGPRRKNENEGDPPEMDREWGREEQPSRNGSATRLPETQEVGAGSQPYSSVF